MQETKKKINKTTSKITDNYGDRSIVSYLTLVSDLDLASNTDQVVASPPVRYINPGCCVNFFQKSNLASSVFCIILNLTMMAIFVCWKILVCASGHLKKVSWGG